MKHTDLYYAFKALDLHEEKELIRAVKAHGGEYIFIHLNEDENDLEDVEEVEEAPVISATSKYDGSYQDYRISRVVVDSRNGIDSLSVFGWPLEPDWPDERLIDSMAHGSRGFIIDAISPTDTVTDVTLPLGL